MAYRFKSTSVFLTDVQWVAVVEALKDRMDEASDFVDHDHFEKLRAVHEEIRRQAADRVRPS